MDDETKDIQDAKINIWLVWDIDTKTKEASLRAITLSDERARKYEKSIMNSHFEFGNTHYFVDVEKRITNHLFGGKLIDTIGAELKKT